VLLGSVTVAFAQPSPPPPARDDLLSPLLGLGRAEGCVQLLGLPSDAGQQTVAGELAALGTAIGSELRALCGPSAVTSASSLGGGLNALQATKTATQFRLVRRRLDSRLPPRRGTKPSRDLLLESVQQPPTPSVTGVGDIVNGIGVFGELEFGSRNRDGTAYESAYESDIDGASVGVDVVRGDSLAGAWFERSRQDAVLAGSSVLFFSARHAEFTRFMNDPAVRAGVCGGGDAAGSFDQDARRYGVFAGLRGGRVFVDGAAIWSRRDHEYTRGICVVEHSGSIDLTFIPDVNYLGDFNGNNVVDANEFEPSSGRGVLADDRNGNGRLDVDDQVPNDDIFAGMVTGVREIREFAYSVRFGGDVGDGRVGVGPRAQFTYTRMESDAYEETGRSTIANLVRPNAGAPVARTLGGPTGLELAYDAQSRRSLLLEVGGEAVVRVATRFGAVLPHAAGYWRHEFDNEVFRITARLVQDRRPTPAFFAFGADAPDANTAVFAGGVTALVGSRFAARFELSQLTYDDLFDSRIVSVQARWQF
jgi:hypothetical protein